MVWRLPWPHNTATREEKLESVSIFHSWSMHIGLLAASLPSIRYPVISATWNMTFFGQRGYFKAAAFFKYDPNGTKDMVWSFLISSWIPGFAACILDYFLDATPRVICYEICVIIGFS